MSAPQERVSADELAYLREVAALRLPYLHFAEHLSRKYGLGPGEGIDEQSGAIVRTPTRPAAERDDG